MWSGVASWEGDFGRSVGGVTGYSGEKEERECD